MIISNCKCCGIEVIRKYKPAAVFCSKECKVKFQTTLDKLTPIELKERKIQYQEKWKENLSDIKREERSKWIKEYNTQHYLKNKNTLLPIKRAYSKQYTKNISNEQKLQRTETRRLYIQKYPEKKLKISRKYKKSKKSYECRIKGSYKLTYEEVKSMFINQDGKCAICHKEFKNKLDMNIDHNHSNNKVRQLLCRSCNRGIGCFYEDINILKEAVEYINKWNSTPESDRIKCDLTMNNFENFMKFES